MEFELMALGTVVAVVAVVGLIVFLAYWFDENVQGRRKFGDAQWEAMKAEEQRQQEEAERRYRAQDESIKACPICSEAMGQENVMGVNIDRCLEGHGVWLDQSELDYIVEEVEADASDSNFTTGLCLGIATGMAID